MRNVVIPSASALLLTLGACTVSPSDSASTESALGGRPPRRCITNDTCDPPPDPPPPPPPPLNLETCKNSPPDAVPSGCAQILADALRARTNDPRVVRPMYHADPAAFPLNLASTTAQNLTNGTFDAANAQAVSLFDTHLAYESGILRDIVARKGSLMNAAPYPWAAHPWYTFTGQPAWEGFDFGSTIATDCREYVWRVWQPLSFMEDELAACGADLGCVAGTALQSPYGLKNVVSYDGTELRINATTLERPTQTATVPQSAKGIYAKNDFFAVNGNIFDNQDDTLFHALADGSGSCGGARSSIGPVMTGQPPTYRDARLGTPAAQQAFAEMRALLSSGYRAVVGFQAPPTPHSEMFLSSMDYNRTMVAKTLGNVAGGYWDVPRDFVPISPAERRGIRERALRMRELLDRYNAMTTLICYGSPLPMGNQLPLATVQHDYASYATAEYGDVALDTKPYIVPASRVSPLVKASMEASNGGGGGGGGGNTWLLLHAQAVAQAAHDIQEQILGLMLDEYGRTGHGCFSTRADHGDCDWFPEDFVPMVTGIGRKERESDFQTCVSWTGNQVAGKTVDQVSSAIHESVLAAERALTKTPGVYASIDPDADANWKNDARAPQPTTGTKVGFGQVMAGGKQFGDFDTFGASYDYGAYWKVTPSNFHGPAGAACNLDGEARISFSAHADMLRNVADRVCNVCDNTWLDQKAKDLVDVANAVPSLCPSYVAEACKMRYRFKNLVDAEVSANVTPAGGSKLAGHFFFAGEQLWNAEHSGDIHASWPATPIDIHGLHDTMIVVVVPVTYDLHGEVHYGAKLDQTLQSVSNCAGHPTINDTITFTPWAYVDAFGTAMIGIDGAGAGVRGHVRVIDAHLPATASAVVDSSGFLNLSAGAELDLDYLSGSISVFAELLGQTAEKELASWGGYHSKIPIFAWQGDPMQLPVLTEARWNAYKQGH